MTKKSIGAKPLPLPAPVWIIGTFDQDGKPNIMTAAWTGICCSKPPCVYVSLQKVRYTYANIMNRKAFTVNVPSITQIKQADYAGMVSGKVVDKFEHTGLTPVTSNLVDAPYVKEFPVIMECKLVTTNDLGIHTMFVGEVMDVQVEEQLLDSDSHVLIEKLGLVAYTGSYYALGDFAGKAFSIGKDI
jgi:flavin reductase (DIM6/NTAB) family NADH-FMN oxidoreductase RutF